MDFYTTSGNGGSRVQDRGGNALRSPARRLTWRGVVFCLLLLTSALLGIFDVGLPDMVAGVLGFTLAVVAVGVAVRK